jgi:hypothetical protein
LQDLDRAKSAHVGRKWYQLTTPHAIEKPIYVGVIVATTCPSPIAFNGTSRSASDGTGTKERSIGKCNASEW